MGPALPMEDIVLEELQLTDAELAAAEALRAEAEVRLFASLKTSLANLALTDSEKIFESELPPFLVCRQRQTDRLKTYYPLPNRERLSRSSLLAPVSTPPSVLKRASC